MCVCVYVYVCVYIYIYIYIYIYTYTHTYTENFWRVFQVSYWSLACRLRSSGSMDVVQQLKPRGNYIHNPEKLCILPKCDYVFCTIIIINTDRFSKEPGLIMHNAVHVLMDLYGFTLLSGIILVERGIILTFERRIKSHLPFAGIIRSSPYSPRFQDKG